MSGEASSRMPRHRIFFTIPFLEEVLFEVNADGEKRPEPLGQRRLAMSRLDG
jgi:hypothetical protein